MPIIIHHRHHARTWRAKRRFISWTRFPLPSRGEKGAAPPPPLPSSPPPHCDASAAGIMLVVLAEVSTAPADDGGDPPSPSPPPSRLSRVMAAGGAARARARVKGLMMVPGVAAVGGTVSSSSLWPAARNADAGRSRGRVGIKKAGAAVVLWRGWIGQSQLSVGLGWKSITAEYRPRPPKLTATCRSDRHRCRRPPWCHGRCCAERRQRE